MSIKPNYVFVLDTNRKPLTPCKPSLARKLLKVSKAKVFRLYPFTIILKKEVTEDPRPVTLKIDPGSKVSGLAILSGSDLIWVAQLTHCPQAIKASLDSRRSRRRGRRSRRALFTRLKETGKEIATGSGGLTKFNRIRLELPKTHFFDAACVGDTSKISVLANQPLNIKATGHGSRQMCRTDKFGFPSQYVPRFKFVKGFQTGDIVKAVVTSGKKIGTYTGRVAVRSSGSFNVSAAQGLIQGINHKYCFSIYQKDGTMDFKSIDGRLKYPMSLFLPGVKPRSFPISRKVFMK